MSPPMAPTPQFLFLKGTLPLLLLISSCSTTYVYLIRRYTGKVFPAGPLFAGNGREGGRWSVVWGSKRGGEESLRGNFGLSQWRHPEKKQEGRNGERQRRIPQKRVLKAGKLWWNTFKKGNLCKTNLSVCFLGSSFLVRKFLLPPSNYGERQVYVFPVCTEEKNTHATKKSPGLFLSWKWAFKEKILWASTNNCVHEGECLRSCNPLMAGNRSILLLLSWEASHLHSHLPHKRIE